LAEADAEDRGETGLYNRATGSEAGAKRASEAVIVPMEPRGQQNLRRGKDRYFVQATREEEDR